MNDSWVLFDQRSGLQVGWYFWLRVLDEGNRSVRYGFPFSLLLLDLEAAGKRGRPDEALAHVANCVRVSDLAGRVGETRAGVLLPHQDAAHAEEAAGRIVRNLTKADRGARWTTRLLTYPADASEISNLLTLGSTDRHAPELEPALSAAATSADDPRR